MHTYVVQKAKTYRYSLAKLQAKTNWACLGTQCRWGIRIMSTSNVPALRAGTLLDLL